MDLIKIRKDLLRKRKVLERGLEVQNKLVLSDDEFSSTSEAGDEAMESQDKMAIKEKVELYEKEISLISKALDDIDQNRYGICNRCEGMISEKRLKHNNYAQYCIKCQKEIDG